MSAQETSSSKSQPKSTEIKDAMHNDELPQDLQSTHELLSGSAFKEDFLSPDEILKMEQVIKSKGRK